MTEKTENMHNAVGRAGYRYVATIVSTVGALALIACMIALPVTLDQGTNSVVLKAAAAKDGNNGGGNGGGGNAGGGNAGGGNAGGGNAGGNGKGKNSNGNFANSDSDGNMILLPTEPTITMAQFTTKITKRYPADEIQTHTDPYQSISFYTELRNMKGEQVGHRWYYEDQLEYEASFKVRADQWRVWSTQLLPEDKPGEWKVEIVNGDGEVLSVHSLKFQPPGPAIAAN